MNPLFDEAKAFVLDTIHRFYAAGDGIEQVVERFTDDFSWVGAGEVEFSADTEEIVAYFLERAPLAPPCDVFDEELCLVNVTERTCTVMGRYRVRTRETSGLVLEERQRCSYELVDEGGALKIRHVHASNPYQAMKDERYFPFEGGMQNYEYLQQLVREKTATIELLTDNITGGLKMSEDDEAYTLAYVNEGLARMLGYTIEELEEMSGGTARGMVYGPDVDQALADVERCFAEGPTYETEYRVRRKDGSLAWVLDSGRKVRTADGTVKIGSVLMDITSRKEAEIALAVEQERYRIALRSVTDVLFEYDIEQDVLVEYERMPGTGENALPDERRFERYTETLGDGARMHLDDYARLSEALQREESVTMDVRRRFGDAPEGTWRWTRMHAMVLYDRSGAAVRTIGSWKDVTDERRRLEDLADQARRDPLTRLLNQGATSEFIEPLLSAGAERRTGALLVVDVDDFKGVNDTLGHLAGDELLVSVARGLEEALADDEAVIARVGGDEFVAFLPHADCVRAREAALQVNGRSREEGAACAPVTLSVGVALAGVDGATYEALFGAADRALYEAKRAGKDRVSFADEARS